MPPTGFWALARRVRQQNTPIGPLTSGALLRMLQRRQVERCQALVRELERIEREATARFNGQQVQEAETATQANGSGPSDSKPTIGRILGCCPPVWVLPKLAPWLLNLVTPDRKEPNT